MRRIKRNRIAGPRDMLALVRDMFRTCIRGLFVGQHPRRVRNRFAPAGAGERLEERAMLAGPEQLTYLFGSVTLRASSEGIDANEPFERTMEASFQSWPGGDEEVSVENLYPYDSLTSASISHVVDGDGHMELDLAVQTVSQRQWQGVVDDVVYEYRQGAASAEVDVALNFRVERLPSQTASGDNVGFPVWIQMGSILRPDGSDPDEIGMASLSFAPDDPDYVDNLGTEYYLVRTGELLSLRANVLIENSEWGGSSFRYAAIDTAQARVIRPDIRADYYWYEGGDTEETIDDDVVKIWYSTAGLAPGRYWHYSLHWWTPPQNGEPESYSLAYQPFSILSPTTDPTDRIFEPEPISIPVTSLDPRPPGATHLELRLDNRDLFGEINEDDNIARLLLPPAVSNAEPPTEVALSNVNIWDVAPNDSLVGFLSATDPTPGDSHTFSLTESAGGRFRVEQDRLLVADTSLLDAAVTAEHQVCVVATDSTGLTVEREFGIRIHTQTFPYHRPLLPADVDGDGTPGLNDALLVISDMRREGVRYLPVPLTSVENMIDVNGDGSVSLTDALEIIALLRLQQLP